MKIVYYFALCLFINLSLFAQKGKIVAGPMQGHTTPTSTKIWLMVKNAEKVEVILSHVEPEGKGAYAVKEEINTVDFKSYKKYTPITVEFNNLYLGSPNQLTVKIDGKEVLSDYQIELPAKEQQDYSFLLGSCALSIPNYLNLLHPGIEDRVYKRMIAQDGEFMLWLGDYLYYRKKDNESPEGMMGRQVHKRLHKRLNKFLMSRPQYSIWDDHDYGPNNSDGSFVFKDSSLEIMQTFWPNPYAGTKEVKGCFYHFEYQDATFFMMDDRFHRTQPEDENPTVLGEGQLNWLKDKLQNSTATFKFVAIGTQVLNNISTYESYSNYPDEAKELLSFIQDNNIPGVIFLTGDRHHTELIKVQSVNGYPFYDFTCSAITSFRRRTRRTPEFTNPDRIPGTLSDFQNFGKITISGPENDRVCLIETFHSRGKLEWSYQIKASEWLQPVD